MSETDDTDVLLLIPPNFFLVKTSDSEDSVLDSSRTVVHKPASCAAQALGRLANRVHSLENRLESLELSSTSDTVSTFSHRRKNKSYDLPHSCDSVSEKYYTFPRRRRRKNLRTRWREESSTTSLDLDSEFKVPHLKLQSPKTTFNDFANMDGELSSITSSPSKRTDNLLLTEIDEFLHKVESYESPEINYQPFDISSKNVIHATSEYLTKKLHSSTSEETKCENPGVLDKYIYLEKNNPPSLQTETAPSNCEETLKPVSALKTNQENSSFRSRMNRSPITRRLTFIDSQKDVQPTSTPKKPGMPSTYSDSFKPSSNKIYDRASKVLEQYKTSRSQTSTSIDTNYIMSPKKEEFKMPRPIDRDPRGFKSYQVKSLETIDTDLLSLSELWGEKKERDKGETIKLEEERMKREHCEALIQELQKKLLEQQEKLAVAVKVDRSKDIAITKLKEAWLKITSSLEKAEERHKSVLDNMTREVDRFKVLSNDSQKKTNQFETELYKALDLAHDYQEKYKQLSFEKQELENKFQNILADKENEISGKQKEIEAIKENYDTVMMLNKQSTDCCKNLEEALQKERANHDETKHELHELNYRIQSGQDESKVIKEERDLLKVKVNEERARWTMLERQLADKQNLVCELMKKCDTLESELHTYNKHLESQKMELKTFYQKQLEDAVLSKLQEFQMQLDKAEKDMEAQSRSKEDAVVDTFNKQMARIQEQHKLEINVMEEKHKEEMKLCRLQLVQATEKISALESKLSGHRRRRSQLAGELHRIMETQWRHAFTLLTGQHADTRDNSESIPEAQDYVSPKLPLNMPSFPSHGILRRDSNPGMHLESLSDTELQSYVKLLLNKPPTQSSIQEVSPSTSSELLKHLHEEPTSDQPDKKDKGKRSINIGKPPWKA